MYVYSVASSTYIMYLNSSLAFDKSFMYIINRSGPIESYGTPVDIIDVSETVPSMSTYCFQLVR